MKITKKIESILYELLCIWAVLIAIFSIWCSFKAEGLFYSWSIVLAIASLFCAVAYGCAVFDCFAEINGKTDRTKMSITDLCIACLTVCIFALNAFVINEEVKPFSSAGSDIVCKYPAGDTGVNSSFVEYNNMKISGSSLRSALYLFEDNYIVVIRTNDCDDEKYAALYGYSNYEVTFDEAGEGLQYLTKEEFNEMFEEDGSKYIIKTAACMGKQYLNGGNEFNDVSSPMYIRNSSRYTSKIIRDKQGAIAGLYVEELGD